MEQSGTTADQMDLAPSNGIQRAARVPIDGAVSPLVALDGASNRPINGEVGEEEGEETVARKVLRLFGGMMRNICTLEKELAEAQSATAKATKDAATAWERVGQQSQEIRDLLEKNSKLKTQLAEYEQLNGLNRTEVNSSLGLAPPSEVPAAAAKAEGAAHPAKELETAGVLSQQMLSSLLGVFDNALNEAVEDASNEAQASHVPGLIASSVPNFLKDAEHAAAAEAEGSAPPAKELETVGVLTQRMVSSLLGVSDRAVQWKASDGLPSELPINETSTTVDASDAPITTLSVTRTSKHDARDEGGVSATVFESSLNEPAPSNELPATGASPVKKLKSFRIEFNKMCTNNLGNYWEPIRSADRDRKQRFPNMLKKSGTKNGLTSLPRLGGAEADKTQLKLLLASEAGYFEIPQVFQA